MYGPHYVWMLLDSQNNNWWIPGKNEESACSDVEMQCQIQNHFSFYNTKVLSPKGRYYNYAKKVNAADITVTNNNKHWRLNDPIRARIKQT